MFELLCWKATSSAAASYAHSQMYMCVPIVTILDLTYHFVYSFMSMCICMTSHLLLLCNFFTVVSQTIVDVARQGSPESSSSVTHSYCTSCEVSTCHHESQTLSHDRGESIN